VLAIAHADAALALDDQAAALRIGLDLQVGSSTRRVEESARRRPAPAVLLRHLVVAEALLVAVVVVDGARIALGDAGVDEGVEDLVLLVHVGDVELAALAAAVVAAALEMLGLLEVRQHRLVGPPAIAELRPGIVVERLSADIQHAVDRARAAQGLAARDRDRAALDVVLRLGGEVPVVDLVVQELGEAHRDRDPEAVILATGFEQQHLLGGILAQPVGQHAARRTRPDNDVVIRRHSPFPSRYPCLASRWRTFRTARGRAPAARSASSCASRPLRHHAPKARTRNDWTTARWPACRSG
jgi:hypothetical protein